MAFLAAAAALTYGPAARADTYVVTSVDDVSGTCSGTSCASIRQALAAADDNPGADTIQVPAGSYQLALGVLNIQTPVTLQGAGARTTEIVAVDSSSVRALEVHAATAAISGFTLRNGSADGNNGPHGGTLMNQGGTVTLDRVRITGGSGLSGGGIANRNGTMVIDHSLIDHNFATNGGGDGGGIINFGGDGLGSASLTVRNTTIAFNQARLSAGLISYGDAGDQVTLENVTIARNTAYDRGIGGIAVSAAEGSYHVKGSVIADNVDNNGPHNCDGPLVSDGGNLESGSECGFEVEEHRSRPARRARRPGRRHRRARARRRQPGGGHGRRVRRERPARHRPPAGHGVRRGGVRARAGRAGPRRPRRRRVRHPDPDPDPDAGRHSHSRGQQDRGRGAHGHGQDQAAQQRQVRAPSGHRRHPSRHDRGHQARLRHADRRSRAPAPRHRPRRSMAGSSRSASPAGSRR